MPSILLRPALVAVLSAAVSLTARADNDSFSLSGFATIGAVRTNSDGAQFVIPGQLSGANRRLDFGVDSKLGVQGVFKLDHRFSATAQVITKQNGRGTWEPGVEWLFGKYQATPDLALRLGRIGVPAFAVSDFRDVNYANLWLRPPLDVYGQMPFSHFDGADVLWQVPAGTPISAQFLMGRSATWFQDRKIEADDLVGFNVTTELGQGLKFRLGHLHTRLSVIDSSVFPPLLGALRKTGFGVLADQMSADRKESTFTGVGVSYEEKRWVASAEYTKRRSRSYVSDTAAWFTTLGYRFGDVTPYVTVGRRKVDDSNVVNSIPVTPIPEIELMRQSVDSVIESQLIGQRTLGLGARWDAARNVAVKVQWERIRTDMDPCAIPAGSFIHLKPGFRGASVLGLSVDILF